MAPKEPRLSTYLTHEASFELEGAFTDRTVHDLEAPLGDDGRLGLWLTREPLPVGGTLRDAAGTAVARRRKRLEGYHLLAEREGQVGNAEAIEFSARFRDGGGVVYERQTHFVSGSVWYCLTTRAPLADRAVCDEAMERVVATLLFRAEP
jgi:hypothetical protein